MKRHTIFLILYCFFSINFLSAQHVKKCKKFPSGIVMVAAGLPPFSGAVWIAPEWQWSRGEYIYVQGYWSKPPRNHKRWTSGYWKKTRRGFIWVPGCWM